MAGRTQVCIARKCPSGLPVGGRPHQSWADGRSPAGFNFETVVNLRGGVMLNQKNKVVGQYSGSKLEYSTSNGAYDQLVDPFKIEADYIDVENIKIKITTSNNKYEVIF